MNKTLRDFKNFCRIYIDNIVLFFKTFDDHVEHFRRLFVKLVELRITFNLKKTFLNYSSITLLKQKIDVFDLSTIEKRIVVIKVIRFSKNFKVLKIYLSLTNYQRKKLVWYAQKTDVLQKEKTRLFKDSSTIESQKRQTYSRTTSIKDSSILRKSFYQLQRALTISNFLVHYDNTRRLYASIDVFKERDYDVEIYHVKSDSIDDNFKKTNIEHVMFLFKILNDVESRYWSIEMKITCLIWIVKKTRHFIEIFKWSTIVYIDHSTTTSIVKHTTFLSSIIDKLNLRLVRTSQYLSQFSLNIRHRVDKLNIVFDVLSRLAIIVEQNDDFDENTLDEIDVYVDDSNTLIVIKLVKHVARKRDNIVATNIVDDVVFFHACLIQMSDEFRKKFIDVYVKSFKWTKIMNTIQKSSMSSNI